MQLDTMSKMYTCLYHSTKTNHYIFNIEFKSKCLDIKCNLGFSTCTIGPNYWSEVVGNAEPFIWPAETG